MYIESKPSLMTSLKRYRLLLAGVGLVAVVGLLKIYGYALGFPNPGLMPTAKERDDQRAVVAKTIELVERLGGYADGQVTATRQGARVIVAATKRRGARHVIIDRPPSGKARALIEGDLVAQVRRRVTGVATVDSVVGERVKSRKRT